MDTREPATGRDADQASRRFPHEAAHLSDIRRFVRNWFEDRHVPGLVIDDFELVVSELATNATQHGAGDVIEVELTVDDTWWCAVVAAHTEHAASVGRVHDWQIAPPDAVSGRGLGIVAAVMDVVEFSGDAGHAVFRCRRRR